MWRASAASEIVAEGVVEGFLAGLTGLPSAGSRWSSPSIAPTRAGDELKYLDWRILGAPIGCS